MCFLFMFMILLLHELILVKDKLLVISYEQKVLDEGR